MSSKPSLQYGTRYDGRSEGEGLQMSLHNFILDYIEDSEEEIVSSSRRSLQDFLQVFLGRFFN